MLPANRPEFNLVTVFMSEDGRVVGHYAAPRTRNEMRPYGDIDPHSYRVA
jgi:hypothetical protein